MRIPIFGGNFGGNITMGVYANVRVLGKVEVHICKMASLGAYHIILDEQSQPDAGTHLALGPDEDDDGNIAQSSFGQFASLAQFCSLT